MADLIAIVSTQTVALVVEPPNIIPALPSHAERARNGRADKTVHTDAGGDAVALAGRVLPANGLEIRLTSRWELRTNARKQQPPKPETETDDDDDTAATDPQRGVMDRVNAIKRDSWDGYEEVLDVMTCVSSTTGHVEFTGDNWHFRAAGTINALEDFSTNGRWARWTQGSCKYWVNLDTYVWFWEPAAVLESSMAPSTSKRQRVTFEDDSDCNSVEVVL